MDEKNQKAVKNRFPQARRSYWEGFGFGAPPQGPRRLLNRIFLGIPTNFLLWRVAVIICIYHTGNGRSRWPLVKGNDFNLSSIKAYKFC